MSRLTCPKPYKIVMILVCVAAGVIGGYFGRIYEMASVLVGGIGGVIAGLLWSCVMLKHTRMGTIGAKLVLMAVIFGIVEGVAGIFLLNIMGHALTTIRLGEWIAFVLQIGLVYAIVAGAVNGLICGIVWSMVAKKYPLAAAGQG